MKLAEQAVEYDASDLRRKGANRDVIVMNL